MICFKNIYISLSAQMYELFFSFLLINNLNPNQPSWAHICKGKCASMITQYSVFFNLFNSIFFRKKRIDKNHQGASSSKCKK